MPVRTAWHRSSRPAPGALAEEHHRTEGLTLPDPRSYWPPPRRSRTPSAPSASPNGRCSAPSPRRRAETSDRHRHRSHRPGDRHPAAPRRGRRPRLPRTRSPAACRDAGRGSRGTRRPLHCRAPRHGQPSHCQWSPLAPAEAVTAEQALYAYTVGSAYAEHAEDRRGRLARGCWPTSPSSRTTCRPSTPGRPPHRRTAPGPRHPVVPVTGAPVSGAPRHREPACTPATRAESSSNSCGVRSVSGGRTGPAGWPVAVMPALTMLTA